MRAGDFDELGFFRAIAESGARALLIGRRALVVLGLPVLTADYDFWIDSDDIEMFNTAARHVDLAPTCSAGEARGRGRYVLENDEHVDVLVARAVSTIDGHPVVFRDLWERRQMVTLAEDVQVSLPAIDDLVLTKRFAARPKDLEDIRLLKILRGGLVE
jgi:hypothetical protein